MGLTCAFIKVSPEMAARWMINNYANRRKREVRVAMYAEAMTQRRWVTTHQGVAFGEDGTLYDGQHRLEAIVKSGVTLTLLVVRGLSSEARKHIDDGAARKNYDNYRLGTGDDMSPMVAQTLRVLWLQDNSMGFGACVPFTVEDIAVTLARHKSGIDWMFGNGFPKKERSLSRAGVLGAFVYAHNVVPDVVEAAYPQMVAGAGLDADDPMWVLRELLLRTPTATGTTLQSSDFRVVLTALRAKDKKARMSILRVSEAALEWFAKRHE